MIEIATAHPAPLSSLRRTLPAGFDVFISRCLAKSRDHRFSLMDDVASSLRRLHDAPDQKTEDVARAITTIAVLPFANVGGDPDNEYFGDGLADELMNGLSQVSALRIASRSSAFAFRGRAVDVRAIGRTLNVDAVLEGSVCRAGNRLRVGVRLVGVADRYHLWSERYDREVTDVFDIQDEIARTIIDKLRPRLIGVTSAASWSPDGKWIDTDSTKQSFWMYDIATRKTRQIADFDLPGSRAFDVTPDGTQIVFDRVRDNADIVLIDGPIRTGGDR